MNGRDFLRYLGEAKTVDEINKLIESLTKDLDDKYSKTEKVKQELRKKQAANKTEVANKTLADDECAKMPNELKAYIMDLNYAASKPSKFKPFLNNVKQAITSFENQGAFEGLSNELKSYFSQLKQNGFSDYSDMPDSLRSFIDAEENRSTLLFSSMPIALTDCLLKLWHAGWKENFQEEVFTQQLKELQNYLKGFNKSELENLPVVHRYLSGLQENNFDAVWAHQNVPTQLSQYLENVNFERMNQHSGGMEEYKIFLETMLSGYDLALIVDGQADELAQDVIKFKSQENGLYYRILGRDNSLKVGVISWDNFYSLLDNEDLTNMLNEGELDKVNVLILKMKDVFITKILQKISENYPHDIVSNDLSDEKLQQCLENSYITNLHYQHKANRSENKEAQHLQQCSASSSALFSVLAKKTAEKKDVTLTKIEKDLDNKYSDFEIVMQCSTEKHQKRICALPIAEVVDASRCVTFTEIVPFQDLNKTINDTYLNEDEKTAFKQKLSHHMIGNAENIYQAQCEINKVRNLGQNRFNILNTLAENINNDTTTLYRVLSGIKEMILTTPWKLSWLSGVPIRDGNDKLLAIVPKGMANIIWTIDTVLKKGNKEENKEAFLAALSKVEKDSRYSAKHKGFSFFGIGARDDKTQKGYEDIQEVSAAFSTRSIRSRG